MARDVNMTVVDLFKHSTIASLVAYMGQGKSDTAGGALFLFGDRFRAV
jgi:hypothetical protein